jgi:hypothetical protein
MNKILFTYDLNKDSPSDKWGEIRDVIVAAFPTHWRRLTTTWIVETPSTPTQVRDWLRQFLDSNDELLVADISGKEIAWAGLDDSDAKWLNDVL